MSNHNNLLKNNDYLINKFEWQKTYLGTSATVLKENTPFLYHCIALHENIFQIDGICFNRVSKARESRWVEDWLFCKMVWK